MQTDLDTLKKRVVEATKQSNMAAQVKSVSVEPDRDDEGTDFLRVIVTVKDADNSVDADFEALLESIERAVGAVDERYASVRFSDAA